MKKFIIIIALLSSFTTNTTPLKDTLDVVLPTATKIVTATAFIGTIAVCTQSLVEEGRELYECLYNKHSYRYRNIQDITKHSIQSLVSLSVLTVCILHSKNIIKTVINTDI